MIAVYVLGAVYYAIALLYSIKEGSKRSNGFIGVALLVFLLPVAGIFIVESFANKKAKGCHWCGNKYNEAVFCGLCSKNAEGEKRPGFIKKQ